MPSTRNSVQFTLNLAVPVILSGHLPTVEYSATTFSTLPSEDIADAIIQPSIR